MRKFVIVCLEKAVKVWQTLKMYNMKKTKLISVLIAAAVSLASCDFLPGDGLIGDDDSPTENLPGTGDVSGSDQPSDPSELRQVISIQMTYVDNREDDGVAYEDEAYIQNFTYDDKGRCAKGYS